MRNDASKAASSSEAIGPNFATPALRTRMSTPSPRCAKVRASAWMSSLEPASDATTSAIPWSSARAAASVSGFVPVTVTFAPSDAKSRAAARPIPISHQ